MLIFLYFAVFLHPSVTHQYFFIVWFSNMNAYKCIWLSKSFGEDLMIAYTWLGSHMPVREREKQYSLNGSPERSNFVTF